jgi:glycosyltransferase involved in cell wall biosynthesis
MKLSILIPCFNERATIEEILARVEVCGYDPKEIIIVDDCSTDGTRDILSKRPPKDSEKVLFHKKNEGKGAALRTGITAVTGDIVIVQDADLEYDPKEIPRIIQPILADRADVVYGSRFVGSEPHRVLHFWHRVGNAMVTLLSNMLTDLDLTDVETCYKAFRTNILRTVQIEESRFGFEPEITAKISKIPGIRIYEIGISYFGRTYSEGKKIIWKDGLWALFCIIKYNMRKGTGLTRIERPFVGASTAEQNHHSDKTLA